MPPSARISSKSSVAPPVIIVRISVNASELKYVADTKLSNTEIANAVPHANGWVKYNSVSGSKIVALFI